jgi:hypothetical protein
VFKVKWTKYERLKGGGLISLMAEGNRADIAEIDAAIDTETEVMPARESVLAEPALRAMLEDAKNGLDILRQVVVTLESMSTQSRTDATGELALMQPDVDTGATMPGGDKA